MITTRILIALALTTVTTLAIGCDKKSGGDDKPAASASAAPAAAAPTRKLKTTLTKKQIDDQWASMKGNNDFKGHTKLVTDKLGAPATVEGDKSTWYGYDAATDDCQALFTSATKGSGTQTASGKGNCWE